MYKTINGELIEMSEEEINARLEVIANRVSATRDEVNIERERRLASTVIKVTGLNHTVHLPGDPLTQTRLLALKDTARDLKAAGVTDPVLKFKDQDNLLHLMTADQMIELVNKGKLYVQQVMDASWRIKEMDPIPENFKLDGYWEPQ